MWEWCCKFSYNDRACSCCFMHTITALMRLPFFKKFSNFVHFYPNFQVFCSFLPIFWKIARMPFFSRIGPKWFSDKLFIPELSFRAIYTFSQSSNQCWIIVWAFLFPISFKTSEASVLQDASFVKIMPRSSKMFTDSDVDSSADNVILK